eukprot:jgi/Mesvir1/1535/Mv14518-RA.1
MSGTPLSEAYSFSPSGDDNRVPMPLTMHGGAQESSPFQEPVAPNPRGSLSAPLASSQMRRPPQPPPTMPVHQGPTPAEIHAARMRQQAMMDCRIRQIAGEEARNNAIKYIVAGGAIAAIAFYLMNKRWESRSLASSIPMPNMIPTDVTASYWPFDAGTPATDTVGSVSMSITGAALANQRLEVTGASQNASASSASWPYGATGTQISVNLTPVTALPTADSFILAYGALAGVYLRLSYVQATNKLMLTDGTNTATTTNAGLLTAGTSAKIVVRRDPTTAAVSLLVNSVPQVLVGGGGAHLAALGALSFASTPSLYVGHFGADASSASFYFDNVRVESVTKPTNAASSSAGILVQGDGAVAGVNVTPTGVGGAIGGAGEVSGIAVAETAVASLNLQADVTNPAYTTGKHSVLRSTNDDLVLSGGRALSGEDTHVVTVGELHAYKGDGVAGSGDAVKVFGKNVAGNVANLNLGVHKDSAYSSTGSTTARAMLSSSATADLTVSSGADQLRLEATKAGGKVRIASSTAVEVFPRVPNDSGNNPSGHLVFDHVTPGAVDGNGFNVSSLVVKSTGTENLALESGSGVVDVLGSLEIGSGATKYRFTVNDNGQLEIQKWVFGVLSKKVQVLE